MKPEPFVLCLHDSLQVGKTAGSVDGASTTSGSFSTEIGISHLVRELTDALVKLQANGDIRDK